MSTIMTKTVNGETHKAVVWNGQMLEIRRGALKFTKAVRLVNPPRVWRTYDDWMEDADIPSPVPLAQVAEAVPLTQSDDEMPPLRDEDTDDDRNRAGEDTSNGLYERDTRRIAVSQLPSAWNVEATASTVEATEKTVEATASAVEATASTVEATASSSVVKPAKRTRVEPQTPEQKIPRVEPGAPQRPARDVNRFISRPPLGAQRLCFGAGGPPPYDVEQIREQLRERFETEMLPQMMHWFKNVKID